MAWLGPAVKKVAKTITPPKRPTITYAADPVAPKNKADFDRRESFIQTVRGDPTTKDVPIESIYAAYQGGQGLPQSPAARPTATNRQPTSPASSGSRGSRRGGGGGGGGGGGATAAQLAQSQLDFLLPMLQGRNYTAQPLTGVRDAIGQREAGIGTATTQDLASSNTAYDALGNWLRSNLNDPYANVKMQQARVAPDQNAYLGSQGVEGLNQVTQNPDDSYSGFQNILQLLGANARQMNTSSMAGGEMARAASNTGINAMDNSYRDVIKQQLAAVSNQEATNQQTLDAERRQALMQILPLLGQGAKAPTDILSQLGLG